MGFQGSVESFSLADVFQNLAMNQQTGTLRVSKPCGEERYIYFESGQVRHLSRGRKRLLLSNEIFMARGLVKQDLLAQALAKQAATQRSIGECLVELGLGPTALQSLIRHQIEEEVYDLFGWEKAEFDFKDGPADVELFKDQLGSQGSQLPISHLIMEAARRVDEWERLRERVPSTNEIYRVDMPIRQAFEQGQFELGAVEHYIFSALDGQRSVEDLIADTGLFRFEVMHALAGFLEASMIRPALPEELLRAADDLEQRDDNARRCKILERLLSTGHDRPEIRSKLADALVKAGEHEKAAIHFNLLAEAALKAGQAQQALEIYQRTVKLLPGHIPSRERVAAILRKQSNDREALYQYLELIDLYREKAQVAQARNSCAKALECDPNCERARKALVDVLLQEGDKRSAVMELEQLGDYYTARLENKLAAECYRRASMILPAQKHLKKKLAGVMLTEEDRRARNKRTLIAGLGLCFVLTIGGLLAFHEFTLHQNWLRTQNKAEKNFKAGQDYQSRFEFKKALDEYDSAMQTIRSSGVDSSWSPVLRTQDKALDTLNRYNGSRHLAQAGYEKKKEQSQQDGVKEWTEAQALLKREEYRKALQLLESVLNNTFIHDEMRTQVLQTAERTREILSEFEDGWSKISAEPSAQFKDETEEYEFKTAFLRRFSRLPELKTGEVLLPLIVKTSVNGVKVFLDGKILGAANRNTRNVFRYSAGASLNFEFEKTGFRKAIFPAKNLPLTIDLELDRLPILEAHLEEELAGNALFDGTHLWIGTTNGSLLQLDPLTLKPIWRFNFPGQPGLDKEVFGEIVRFDNGSEKLLLYSTKSGHCVAVKPGQSRPFWPIQKAAEQFLKVPPAIVPLELAGNKAFFLIAANREVIGIQCESGVQLWSGKSSSLPMPISTIPTTIQNNSMIVVGCEDGNLYGFDVRDGSIQRIWRGRGVILRGKPLASATNLIASADNGDLMIFGLEGGLPKMLLNLKGRSDSPMAIHRNTIFAGTRLEDGFYAIDAEQLKVIYAMRRDRIDGSVTAPATAERNKVYFGTTNAAFYALDRDNSNKFELSWSYRSKQRRQLVSRPVVTDNRVIFICNDGRIYAFEE